MDDQTYTIGELSKLSGVSVRRLRFYSDKGLLPPTARALSGYRVYSAADLARLSLILALRDAGVSLRDIKSILSRRLGLSDVLALRLQTIEADILAKRRIAAALRAALRTPNSSQNDLRRLWTVTQISQTEFRAAVERFYDFAAAGTDMDPAWRKQMIDAATPELPDEPTPEQIDAWVELMEILQDNAYAQHARADMQTMWSGEFDATAYAEASKTTFAQVKAAMEQGHEPESEVGNSVAQDWLDRSARAMRRAPDKAFLDWQLEQYRKHHSRSARYQELMAILRGDTAGRSVGDEWRWITKAMEHHLRLG